MAARKRMVDEQIRRRGVHNAAVLSAVISVPRHLFVPGAARDAAYADAPLAIGHKQTISQPYIVALMTAALELVGNEKVLEVGTGSGYQAAILSRLAGVVHTIEIVPGLAARAARLLRRLGCANVTVHVGDGSLGWPRAAPYDAIIVTAAAPSIPEPLFSQLVEQGRLVVPVASRDDYQVLTLVRRSQGHIQEHDLASVAFVPLRGRFGIRD
jgi:protein-L-isoaspartate(D-aspartate) O-methyltransferase